MWTRKDLKEKAKGRIKPNYWRTVLVSLIFLIIVGGASAGSSVASSMSGAMTGYSTESNYDSDQYDSDSYDYDEDYNMDNYDESEAEAFANDFIHDITSEPGAVVGIVMIVIVVLIIFLIFFAIAMAIQCLLLNPLVVGCDRYFVTNLSTDAELKEVCYTYDRGYKNGVKVMFFRDLYTFLWSLLFIIPGIVKSYEYRMIPYLLAENPDIDKETAFAMSKQMMTGNKWKAFVLDLSFIGWYLLSALTCGILNIFYVNPYANLTSAALYVELRDNMNTVTQEQLVTD